MTTTPQINLKRRELENTIRSAKGDPTKIAAALETVNNSISKVYSCANMTAQKAAAARPINTIVDKMAPDTKIPNDYARPKEAAEAIYLAIVKLEDLTVPIYGLAVPPANQFAALVPMVEAIGWETGYRLALGK